MCLKCFGKAYDLEALEHTGEFLLGIPGSRIWVPRLGSLRRFWSGFQLTWGLGCSTSVPVSNAGDQIEFQVPGFYLAQPWVSQLSTNQTWPCLASEIRQYWARSGWYGHRLSPGCSSHLESKLGDLRSVCLSVVLSFKYIKTNKTL